ncbi:MAG: RNA-guided endonuclease InsQ/TnpB family protein [Candidatus Hodarchaeota archaeon]
MRLTTVLKICSHKEELKRMGKVVTALYNLANYERRKAWRETGKIPNYYQQYYALRNHELARLLPSHTVQQTLKTLEHNYRSWYALRKNGDKTARPPGFRKPKHPSTFRFTNYQFKIINDKIIILTAKNLLGENIEIKVKGNPKTPISKIEKSQTLTIVFRNGKKIITANLTFKIPDLEEEENGKIMGIDLGIKNIATTYDTADGEFRIYKGGKILSTQYYFNKQIQMLQKKLPKKEDGKTQQYSKNITKLHKKKARQIKHQLHCIANDIVKTCEKKGIKAVVVGDLKNIRKANNGKGRNLGRKNNQKLHSWSYCTLTSLLEYKLKRVGMVLKKVSEKYTSRTCPVCGDKNRKNREKRGSFKCTKCGYKNHPDVIGAINILKTYQYGVLENVPNCNPRVNSGNVVKWDTIHLTCTEAPSIRAG